MISKVRLSFSYKWIKKIQNCIIREEFVPIMLSHVRFNLKKNKTHQRTNKCWSLFFAWKGKKICKFSRLVTVAWRHQTCTAHLSIMRSASFKRHCKIRKMVYSKRYASSFRTFWSTHVNMTWNRFKQILQMLTRKLQRVNWQSGETYSENVASMKTGQFHCDIVTRLRYLSIEI